MASVRFFSGLFVVISVIFAVSSVAQHRGLRDMLEVNWSISTANETLLGDLSAYYREHAKVRLGRENRLANGVAWRLQTDIRTGLSVPRLTWMPDRDRLKIANGLFEAVHGELLARYEKQYIEYRTHRLYDWQEGGPLDSAPGPPFGKQVKVAVTYASARLVSSLETGMEYKATSFWLEVRGLVLDLERGRISMIEACKEEREGGFRLGELLDVCDDQSLERFIAIWVNKVETAMERHEIGVMNSRSSAVKVCIPWIGRTGSIRPGSTSI